MEEGESKKWRTDPTLWDTVSTEVTPGTPLGRLDVHELSISIAIYRCCLVRLKILTLFFVDYYQN